MRCSFFGLFWFLPGILSAQIPAPGSPGNEEKVMIVGVAHDDSVMGGGIGSSHSLPPGEVGVQPIAWMTAAGEWKKLSCTEAGSSQCKVFNKNYLSKPHNYTVVSGDGRGASVHVDRMSIDDECFGIGGRGTFTGGPIRHAAVAAESPEVFSFADPARRLPEDQAEPVRKAMAAAVGKKLDTTKELRVYSVEIDGQPLFVIQRAFQDWADKPEYRPPASPDFYEIFAIASMRNGRFNLLFWKENTGDDNEQILGLIHLKSGRDFLVTSSNNPEGNSFRVYGIRNGQVALILEGGGGSC